jgi:hypothetical protein
LFVRNDDGDRVRNQTCDGHVIDCVRGAPFRKESQPDDTLTGLRANTQERLIPSGRESFDKRALLPSPILRRDLSEISNNADIGSSHE